MTLTELISPIDTVRFVDEHWEQRPLMIAGAASRFSPLFRSADLGRLLHYGRPRPPKDILVVKGSRHSDVNWTESDGTPRLDRVRAAWRDGYSIVVNGMSRFWEPIALLAAALQADIHHPVNVNMYFTPPDSAAFEPHFDIMDTFILQVEGSKVWQVREPLLELPLPDEHRAISLDILPSVVLEEEMRPGSVLYIPRGFIHSARTSSSSALHLTVGVNVVTWLDLLSAALSGARDRSGLRKALPPGFFSGMDRLQGQFNSVVADVVLGLSLEDAAARLATRVASQAPPPGDESLAAEPELGPDTVLARRAGVICRAEQCRNYAAIQYSGGEIRGPGKIGPSLKYVAAQQVFRVRSLPGDLNDREKLVLMRRLIREGVLEIRAGQK